MEQEFIKDVQIFQKAMDYIEAKHYYWFESRYGETINQEHDLLKNHILVDYKELNRVLLEFVPGSELPPNIRAECELAFREIFYD
ncbi:hypothetical protein SNE25_09530 [Mucilaginibacter sabulilitoris]|uniref:Uncharacterized protein n=1 Tax=Mucilaginibacter sabulilitoris TaxID=1173583 RepID=A0ABZ0TRK4_9SPHI|nr:hypothetical protein [Mucilaginibacter sabulilitoris]WPU95758.1 hypothetical protein SNE25_09530 [Mucilaginibacter sabulilitoris]